MKRRSNVKFSTAVMSSILVLSLAAATFAEQKDQTGCKDHPMFTRMPVEGNALFFSDAIRNTGHAVVYGMCFDTAKSELKPESEQAVAEIAKLLNTDPALNL